MKLYLIIIFSSFSVFSQKIKVLDIDTKDPISYSVIYFYNNEKKIDTKYTDEKGELTIDVNSTYMSITVGCMGYENRTLTKEEIKEKIFLKTNFIPLNEVVLTNRSTELLGNLSQKTNVSYPIIKNNAELSFFIENAFKAPCAIKSFKFYYTKKTNKLDYIIRFRIYKKIENSNVSNELFNIPNNFFEIKEKSKKESMFTLDLSDYNLVLPKEGAFVSIEIIEIKEEGKDFIYNTNKNKDLLFISYSTDYPKDYTMVILNRNAKNGVSMRGNDNLDKKPNAKFILEVFR